MNRRRGRRAVWYGLWLSGSFWMIWVVPACFIERSWGYGFAALAAAILNVAIVGSLAPWKHRNVPFGMLCLPLIVLQIVMTLATIQVFDPVDPFLLDLPFEIVILALILMLSFRKTRRRTHGDAAPS